MIPKPLTRKSLLTIGVTMTAFAFWAASSFLAVAAVRDEPRPPCGGDSPNPAYALPGAPPAVRVWTKEDAARWMSPACAGWPKSQRFKLIVGLAGDFNHEGDAEALLGRFGAISAMRGLRYWSVTGKKWRVLIKDAAALEAGDAQRRRADFSSEEMKKGVDLFFAQEDNRSSAPVVYRLRVLEGAPERLVIETENVGPVRAFGITLFPPGSLRATYFLEKRRPGVWSFYGLSATGEEASALAAFSEASYINRAAALYRHLIGIPV